VFALVAASQLLREPLQFTAGQVSRAPAPREVDQLRRAAVNSQPSGLAGQPLTANPQRSANASDNASSPKPRRVFARQEGDELAVTAACATASAVVRACCRLRRAHELDPARRPGLHDPDRAHLDRAVTRGRTARGPRRAESRSGTSMRKYPPNCSFVSRRAVSTLRFAVVTFTSFAVEVGCTGPTL